MYYKGDLLIEIVKYNYVYSLNFSLLKFVKYSNAKKIGNALIFRVDLHEEHLLMASILRKTIVVFDNLIIL